MSAIKHKIERQEKHSTSTGRTISEKSEDTVFFIRFPFLQDIRIGSLLGVFLRRTLGKQSCCGVVHEIVQVLVENSVHNVDNSRSFPKKLPRFLPKITVILGYASKNPQLGSHLFPIPAKNAVFRHPTFLRVQGTFFKKSPCRGLGRRPRSPGLGRRPKDLWGAGRRPALYPPRPSPILAVEGAELDGLGDMLGLDLFTLIQVCYGTGDTEDPVIAAARQSHFIKGVL